MQCTDTQMTNDIILLYAPDMNAIQLSIALKKEKSASDKNSQALTQLKALPQMHMHCKQCHQNL